MRAKKKRDWEMHLTVFGPVNRDGRGEMGQVYITSFPSKKTAIKFAEKAKSMIRTVARKRKP